MSGGRLPDPFSDPGRLCRMHKRWRTVGAIAISVRCLMLVLITALGLGVTQRSVSVTAAEPRAVSSRSGAMAVWTFEGELTVLVYHGSDDRSSSAQSAAHIWLVPGTDWRVELALTGPDGAHRSILGSDGSADWSYDPDANLYTLEPSTPGAIDPRNLFLGGELGLPGTFDLASAIGTWRQIPGKAVTDEGTDPVRGRVTEKVLISPATCVESVSMSASQAGTAASTPTTTCAGSCRYWMDTEPGWVLRSACDDGMGGGFEVTTSRATFDGPIDSSLFQFTPPPGSIQTHDSQSTAPSE